MLASRNLLLIALSALASIQLSFAQGPGSDAVTLPLRAPTGNRGYERRALRTDSEVLDEILKTAESARKESWDGQMRDDYTDYTPGFIPIAEDVSPSGARVYSVPIQTAAGWRLTPQLSLAYNSQAGNGVAGYGWEVAGLSSIRDRSFNHYYDGSYSSPLYDSPDAAYSLDGVPLVQSEGAVYGYSFETTRGHIQVKKHSSPSGAALYFTALYPDGSVATFGYTDATDPHSTYPITSLTDIDGNTISFSYVRYIGNYYISRVDYGLNSSIEFMYTVRNDTPPPPYGYTAGELSSYPTRLLESITSRDGNTTICQYTLTHEVLDGVSLLKQISCTSGASELYPITFFYDIDLHPEVSNNFVKVDSSSFQSYYTKTATRGVIYRRGRLLPGSASDCVVSLPEYDTYTKIDSSYYLLKKYYKYGSAYYPNQQILCNLFDYPSATQTIILAGGGFQTIEALDVDGDGVDELVKVNNGSTSTDITDFTITVYSFDAFKQMTSRSFTVSVNAGTHNPRYNNPAKCFYRWGDFRGDGRPMLLIMTRQSSRFALIDLNTGQKVSESSLFTMSDEESNLVLCADLENDGRDDLCHVTDSGIDVYSLTSIVGTSFSYRTTYSGATRSSLCVEPNYTINGIPQTVGCQMEALDLNGDGYREIVSYPLPFTIYNEWIFTSSTVNVAYFNGSSFDTFTFSLYPRSTRDRIVFLDVDKDGLPDMLHIKDSRMYVVPNIRGVFTAQSAYVNVQLDSTSELIPGSLSRNNRFGEILVISGPNVTQYKYGTDHGKLRLLESMRSIPGLVHQNIYESAYYDAGVYLEDGGRTYDSSSGFKRMRVPISLLYNSRTRLNAEIIHDEYYTYWDAVINARGLGFCGFGKIRSLDYNQYTSSVSVLDPERFGVVTSSSSALLSASEPYLSVTNTYDSHSTTYGKLNPRLTGSVSADNLTGITTTTNITYDAYDFPITVSTARRIGSGEAKTEFIGRTYQHSASATRYVLGSVTGEYVQLEGDGSSSTSWRRRTAITYDSSFRPLTRKYYTGPQPNLSGLVSETRWQYDSHGNVISEETAPYGATTYTGTSYSYDSSGRYLVSSTDELGHTTTYGSYNKFGKPASVTDYRGRVTAYTYDAWGNLIRTAHPDGGVDSTLVQWGGSKLYTVTQVSTGQPRTEVHYDALGREVRSGVMRFDGQWQWVDTYYGSDGLMYSKSLPFRGEYATRWNSYEYDDYRRVTRLQEPSGKVTTWSYNGASTTTVKDGITSTSTTDASGNVVSVTDGGGTITYTLRDDGQPSSITSGGVTTTITYDNYGRRILLTDPGAGTYADTCAWNADGSRVETHSGPGGTKVSSYDRYGRTTSVSRQGEFSTSYTYDNYGRLASETSTNGTMTEYTYDGLDRVATRKETAPDGKWLQSTYTYGQGSVLSSIQYTSHNGLITTEYCSYSNGHETGITLSDSTLVWQLVSENELGLVTEINTGTINREYGYTAFGLPTFRKMNGGALQHFTYQFDVNTGNLLSRQDLRHSTGETFGYDSLNRLTAIGSRQIAYAPNGNITSMGGVGAMSYGDAVNPYVVTSLLPEAGGPGILIPKQSVTYNSFERPATITQNGVTATLTYNADGDRVKMTVTGNSGTLLSRHYIAGRYECDSLPSGQVKERLYLGGDAYSAPMVYQRDSLGGAWIAYNIGRDYLGNITQLATVNGTLVAEYSYDPWGRLRNPGTLEIFAAGSEPELFLGRGYTGHEHLNWFGLINMNARLYDPLLGRFLSPDPYVQAPDFTQNFNRYSYALNNPLRYSDESGEYVIWDDIAAGLIGGVINWAINGFQFNTAGLAYFGIGFVGGIASIYISPIVSAGVISGANSVVRQGFGVDGNWNGERIDWTAVGFSAVMGSMTAWAGGELSSALSGSLGYITSKIPGKAWAGMINKGISCGATGFLMSGSISAITQFDEGGKVNWDKVWVAARDSGLSGLSLGAIAGTAEGIKEAHVAGENPWAFTDKQLNPSTTTLSYHSLGAQSIPFKGRKLSDKYLEKLGLNPHEIKAAFMGNGNNSVFNIYKGPHGQLFVCRPVDGVYLPTYYFIKGNSYYIDISVYLNTQ